MLLAVVASMLTPFACLCAGQDGPKVSPTDQVRQPSSGAPAGGKEEVAYRRRGIGAINCIPGGLVSHQFSPYSGVQSAGRDGAAGRLCHAAGKTLPEFRNLLQEADAKIGSCSD